jgi:hypothetical protein
MVTSDGRKSISVKKLKDILDGLGDDVVLVPNDVKNLSVIKDYKHVGFVDIAFEKHEEFNDEPD